MCIAGAWIAVAADTPAAKGKASKPSPRPAAKGAATKSPAAKRSTTARRQAPKSPRGKNTKTARPAAARYRQSTQQQPAADRYREIQQALAGQGYFYGPVDGNWGPESVDSLKRFQRDQNLDDDGKLGALSLIALGLGPQRNPAAATATAAAPQP